MPRAMSSALDSSSGEWLTPPFRLRTKSIPVGTPAAARIAGVVAGAGDELGGARGRRAQRFERRRRSSRPARRGRWARSRSRRRAGRARSGSPARASTETVTRAGTTLTAPGSTCDAADRGDRARPRRARDVEDELGGRDERVVARVHRRRAGVVGAALEDDLAAGDAGDRRSRSRSARPRARAPGPARRAARGRPRAAGRRRRTRCSRRSRAPRRGRRRPRAGRRAARPARSPATTPSAPSKRPPFGTESRCEPTQTRASPRRPTVLPAASTSTVSPASRIQTAASRCAASSSGEPPMRVAPIAYICSRRSRTRSTCPFWTCPGDSPRTCPGRSPRTQPRERDLARPASDPGGSRATTRGLSPGHVPKRRVRSVVRQATNSATTPVPARRSSSSTARRPTSP